MLTSTFFDLEHDMPGDVSEGQKPLSIQHLTPGPTQLQMVLRNLWNLTDKCH